MKKNHGNGVWHDYTLKKTFRIMRFVLFLLLVSVFQSIASNGYSQSAKVTLKDEVISLESVLNEIEDQSEYRFIYNKSQIDLEQKVNVNFVGTSVKKVLEELFVSKGINYQMMDNQIILTSISNYSDQNQIRISGSVVDFSGQPLPGVSIVIKGTTTGTITDFDGNFNLASIPTDATLVFSFVGMRTQVVEVAGQSSFKIILEEDAIGLEEVVAIGYGTKKKESITGAISVIDAEAIEHSPVVTVSSALAGKIAGVSFRQAEGRPGSSASIQIRNMGAPLYIIDGVEKDGGHFNNLSPGDIESISVLKDGSAAIYGVRAANGVIIVTTKIGKLNTAPKVNINAYTGFQNWTRWGAKGVNSYDWMLGKVRAELNGVNPNTNITPEELQKYQEGTEYGYKSFDWYDFIIKGNAPQTSINVNTSGGSDKIRYYFSLTRLDQSSVLGREFKFNRTNLQSNVEANITDDLKVGIKVNGRIETRDVPGVPGVDDYNAPKYALLRNRPTERPYANDNPEYVNNIGHNAENWGLLNKKLSGYWTENWRIATTSLNAEYKLPIKGLTVKGVYSWYHADKLMNGHEYTYKTYTYFPKTEEYKLTFHNKNPWRERGTTKVLESVYNGQVNYVNSFGNHNFDASFIAERTDRKTLNVWVHSVPTTNSLPLLYFDTTDEYRDSEYEEARIGYVGKFNYSYGRKYYFEFLVRRDGSWKFAPDRRWGTFPYASVGWRITEEGFAKDIIGEDIDLKLRGSYGELGDDNIGIGSFDHLSGYNYATSKFISDGDPIVGIRDRGKPITNISWFTSKITNIGIDYSAFNGAINGTVDYFYRKRSGLKGTKYDIILPLELGYSLPPENVGSDANMGIDMAVHYNNSKRKFKYEVGGNLTLARHKFLESYKPVFGNSWDHYRTSSEDRWTGLSWLYEAEGQFQSFEEINDHPIDNDGQGNKTMLPGDVIYKDVNKDGRINDYDRRPLAYSQGGQPMINFGINFSASWKSFDLVADFSGASGNSFQRRWELAVPYQNTGNLNSMLYEDSWQRADAWDVNSQWLAGKYPALRWNNGGHANYRTSTFWNSNITYLRARTLEIGYSLPASLLRKVKMSKFRIYVSTYNLFSIDNLSKYNVDPEVGSSNGLQYPQHKTFNLGVNVSL